MRKLLLRSAITLMGFLTFTSYAQQSPGARRAVVKAPSLNNLKLNGVMIYDNNKDVNTFGLYSYSATSPIQRKVVQLIPRVSASGGAVVDGGKLYTYDYAIDYGYVSSAYYITYDIATGEQLSKKSMGYDLYPVYHHAATAVATDPVSKKVYCCSHYYNEATKVLSYNLSTWDLEGMAKDSIAPLAAPMRVMACSADGTLYGITASTSTAANNGGMLVKIDKTTGDLTKIGDTGVKPKYFQSGTIDVNSGAFYWFANEEDESANLYNVNLSTGSATKIGALPFGDQVVAAYVAAPEAIDGAPSTAVNASCTFAGGSLEGSVDFDMPKDTYDGKALEGDVTYKIFNGTVVLAQGVATAGAHISEAITVEKSGSYTFDIALSNSIGDSPIAQASAYIGLDTPLAVENLALTRTDKVNTLTWTVPTGTVNGGYMNAEDLRYKIVRQPDNVIVAEANAGTSFSETFDVPELSSYYYEVAAVNGEFIGASVKSNSVKVGDAINPPYSQDFTDATSPDLFTIIDANNDGSTWAYSSKTMRYRTNYSNDADDWLMTPPLQLKANSLYTLKYTAYGLSTRNEEKLMVMMGKASTVDGMTVMVKDLTTYANTSRTPAEEEVTLTPTEDGIYYIGFHVVSAKAKGNLTIDNISVSAPVSTAVPDVVSDLSVKAAYKGALSATVNFKSPAKTAGGDALTSLTKIDILRNGNIVKSFELSSSNVAEYSYTDEPTANGSYIYSVECYNTEGKGDAVSDTVYVGIDTPLSPKSVAVKDNYDGTALVAWQEVDSIGKNLGYVDASAVKYSVYDNQGSVIAKDITGTSYSVSGLAYDEAQAAVNFSVNASNEVGTSADKTESATILIGKSLSAPFNESFAGAKYMNEPWTNETLAGKSYDSKWAPRSDQDQNGDGGSADFYGYVTDASSRLSSPKIDISSLKNPYLSLWSIMPTGNVDVKLQISVDNGDWQDLATLSNTSDWARTGIDLGAFKSTNVRIAFLGVCLKDYNFAYIDNIAIEDVADYDLKITDMTATNKVNVGDEINYEVTILNSGAKTAENVIVELSSDALPTAHSKTVEAIKAQESVTVQFAVKSNSTFAGKYIFSTSQISFEGDKSTDDNTSDYVKSFIQGNVYPVVEELSGAANNETVTLTWSEPTQGKANATKVLDDFESYAPFTTTGFGSWTVTDVDKAPTYVFAETSSWPNAGQPQAFMVMDTKAEYFTGLDIDKRFGMTRTYGDKLAICWSAEAAKTPLGHNDDWLISQELATDALHDFTFSARSYSEEYKDAFEVYYSTTGNAVSDFTTCVEKVDQVNAEWTEYSCELPANAKYVAIRCVSKDAFILGIDNVLYYPNATLTANPTFKGYNIYRNGELIIECATATSFTDSTPIDGTNTYAVSAVYEEGESCSAAITVSVTVGIESIKSGIQIGTNGGLSISGTNGADVCVYDVNGRLLISSKGDVSNQLLQSGIYIVTVNHTAHKVIIK